MNKVRPQTARFLAFAVILFLYVMSRLTVLLGAKEGPLTQMERSLSRAFNGGGAHIFLWTSATTGGNLSAWSMEATANPGSAAPTSILAWAISIPRAGSRSSYSGEVQMETSTNKPYN